MSHTLYVNGRVLTPGRNRAEATSLLAHAGRVVALDVGRDSAPAGTTEVDLRGGTALPGPVDAHCHLVSYGMVQLREADLRGADSLDEIARRLRALAAREPGGAGGSRPRWLLGRGFEQDRLVERRWPTRQDLDEVAPDTPVRITRVCGHAMVANSAALRAAGLDPEGPYPQGEGVFPEGVLTEEAQAPIHRAIPSPTADEWLEAARWACGAAARAGFVGVHSLMAHRDEMRALVRLRAEGLLPVRVQMQPPFAMVDQLEATGLQTGFGDEFLVLGAVKLFSDGSLGARTAAMIEPYSDDSATCGELIYPPDELAEHVRRVLAAGFQVCVHAIGDRAMEVTLDAIEHGLAAAGPQPMPPRIEHASVVNAGIVRRMRALHVAAAIQPQFASSDYWVPERLGPARARGCYAFRTLWDAGVPMAGSTDCPVERLDALAAIGNLIDRPAWSPDEGLPLEGALRVFSEGAYALQGRVGGRLSPGDYSDFIVLNRDPRSVAPEEVEHLSVTMTVVGGQVVYRAEQPDL